MKNAFTLSCRFFLPKLVLTWVAGLSMLNLSAQSGNYFAGNSAGKNNTGSDCTAVGASSLSYSNSGYANSAFGCFSLHYNTTGEGNTAIGRASMFFSFTGNYNTAVGAESLSENESGNCNTALGAYTLSTNAGDSNTAVGYSSLHFNSGSLNTSVGNRSLYSNAYGSSNTATGNSSLYSNTNGFANTANGDKALYWNTTGYNNTATGSLSLYSNTIGFFNTASGSYSLASNKKGNYNTANGYEALYANDSGYYNTANGSQSLYSNISGNSNTASGKSSLYSNTKGYNNTAAGYQSLYSNTTGYDNTANGYQALYSNKTGKYNAAYGDLAMYPNTTGSSNTANGYFALSTNSTGSSNTAVGSSSLRSSTGSYNTGIGSFTLSSNTTGTLNTALGYSSDVSTGNLTNATAIGYKAIADASNKVRIGNTAVTSIGGQVDWATFSDGRYKKDIKENIPGLAFINSLRPVTYTVNVKGLNEYFRKGSKQIPEEDKEVNEQSNKAEEAAGKIIHTGFVAQEVEEAAKRLNYAFDGVDKPQHKEGLYGLRYAEFVVPLVKAVQELSASNNIKDAALIEQEKINANLQKQIDDLKALLITVTDNRQTSINNQKIMPSAVGSLEQNAPNPFSSATVIRYQIPAAATGAQIIITNLSGTTVKTFTLTNKGAGNVTVNAGELSAGSYYYTLIVDGKKADSKQMVLIR